MTKPLALTIAGSDSGGGAGIQADLKTFEALGVFGTSVVTAVTAQNTREVTAVHEIPAAIVRAQLEAVFLDLPPSAVKIGMLASVPAIRVVSAHLRRVAAASGPGGAPPVVLDPVMVAKSGARLLRATSVSSLLRDLLPVASLVTPNLPEASVLAGFPIRSEADVKAAARRIQSLGAQAVLIKGGHGEGAEVVDGLLDGRTWHRFTHERIETVHTHGTGCTLSSAIAAFLARGENLPDAVERALDYVHRAVCLAPGLGGGHGPLGHREAGRALESR
jgi:hydroxymethylpyrimidine/phosphomethylpyrimidine kinase